MTLVKTMLRMYLSNVTKAYQSPQKFTRLFNDNDLKMWTLYQGLEPICVRNYR